MLIDGMGVLSILCSCHKVRRSTYKKIQCSVRNKKRDLWQDKFCLLHHDNKLVHNVLSIRQILAEGNITVLEQSLYTPVLAPGDFFLFSKLKRIFKGTHFENMEAIKRTIVTQLRSIPEESFQQCIEVWQRRVEKYIRLEWDYFQGKTM